MVTTTHDLEAELILFLAGSAAIFEAVGDSNGNRIFYPFIGSEDGSKTLSERLPAIGLTPVASSPALDNPIEVVNFLVRCFADTFAAAEDLGSAVEIRIANRGTIEHAPDVVLTAGRMVYRDVDIERPVCDLRIALRGKRYS